MKDSENITENKSSSVGGMLTEGVKVSLYCPEEIPGGKLNGRALSNSGSAGDRNRGNENSNRNFKPYCPFQVSWRKRHHVTFSFQNSKNP